MLEEVKCELDEITQFAKEHSIAMVPGTFEGDKFPVADWDTAEPDSYRSYIEIAKILSCPLVVVERNMFDEQALEDLRPTESEESDGDEEEEPDAIAMKIEEKWSELTRGHSRKFGSMFSFTLHYFSGGICYRYDKEANWYEELSDSAKKLREELEAAEAASDVDLPELTKAEIESFARELANCELFQKAANQNARRFALEKKFPQIADDHAHRVSELIYQAKGILDLEIRPQLEASLDEDISKLMKQGLTKNQIAKQLKVTVSRVSKAI